MKFLRTFLIVIASLALVFASYGYFKKSVNYGAEISVNKPISEVWDLHKDHTKFDQWLEGFKSIEHLTGEKDAIGSTYKVIVNPGEGQDDFEMIETVVGFKENEYVDLHFDSDMMVFEQKTSFKESGGQTIVTTESKASGKGIAMRAMFGAMEMFAGSFAKQEQKNLDALKKMIEAQ